LSGQIQRTIKAFNAQVDAFRDHASRNSGPAKSLVPDFIDTDPSKISWTLSLKNRLASMKPLGWTADAITVGTYRPFFRQAVYFDRGLNHITGQAPRFFPGQKYGNHGIYQVGLGSAVPFSVLTVDAVPDLHVTGAGSGGQFFGRWRYERNDDDSSLFDPGEGEVIDGYRRIDNITDEALGRFRTAYEESFTKDDIFFYVYGLLHSPEYRETYAADLKKMLPRIPLVEDAAPFVDAGRKLSELHLGYESVTPYPLDGLDVDAPDDDTAYDVFRVEKMAFAKARDPETKKLVADKSTVIYNDRITLSGIPQDAYRYMLGSRSAVEWIIDRYQVKTDKASGIVNDPNDWSREVGDPRYIIDLLARIVTVSLETMQIVDALPPLDILENQQPEKAS
jgi:predicted helicase